MDLVPLAVLQSLLEAKEKEDLTTTHQRQLDKVLHVNGYKRVEVPANGDCFFTSIIMQVESHGNDMIQELREECFEHIQNHIKVYEPYMGSFAKNDLTSITKKGVWNTKLMDIMPYVASNILQSRILVFRSTMENPFERIEPSLSTVHQKSVFKARGKYLVIAWNRADEHYDYAIPIKGMLNRGCIYM